MSDSPAPTPPDWTRVLERTIGGMIGRPPFVAAYTGPVWESSGPEGTRMWKIAVLERRPAGGADHWGHLFIVVAQNTSKVRIRSGGGWLGDAHRPELESLLPVPGLQLSVLIRPRTEEHADRLRAFAIELQRRIAADGTD
jgi:hypothetical protein